MVVKSKKQKTLGAGVKCWELKRCADRVSSRTQDTESPQRQISVLELFALHFYSIDISYSNRFAKYGIYGTLLHTVGLP